MQGTWLGLAEVLAAGLPACVAAVFGYLALRIGKSNAHELVTGNEKTVGEMVTEVHGEASLQNTNYDTHR